VTGAARITRDLIAVVDALLERPYADAERLGIYGSSYGGLHGGLGDRPDGRFRAAVSRAPVFDLESFYGTSDIGYTWSESQFRRPAARERRVVRGPLAVDLRPIGRRRRP